MHIGLQKHKHGDLCGLNNDRLHVNLWGSAECTARARF